MRTPRRHHDRRSGNRARAAAVLSIVAASATGCSRRGALDPQGHDAALVAGLWWWMLAAATLVLVLVLVLLAVAVGRRQRRLEVPGEPLRRDDASGERRMRTLVVAGGVVLPLVAALSVVGGSIYVDRAATVVPEPSVPASQGRSIWVIGNRWWWDVVYVEDGEVVARTANEVGIPAGEPVLLHLASNGVIHSFWVPRLSGKVDANPRRVTSMSIEATQPGEYQGRCAEFCGVQHAHMGIRALAMEPARFEQWLARQATPAEPVESDAARRGQALFRRQGSCGSCHSIAGVDGADGLLGPDLTHLASRSRIAGGILENDSEALERFVTDPQEVKPGALMPRASDLGIEGEELDALVAYLGSLE